MVSRTELEAINNFRTATQALTRASANMEENVGLRTILLKKQEGLQKLEQIILGNGIRRDILNFIILKNEQKKQRKAAGLSKREFKELRKREKQRKKELERAQKAKELQEQQEELTREMFGAEEAERIINTQRAENLAQTIERDMILAEAEKGEQDKEAAERAKARAEEEKAREEEEKKINSLTEAARAIEAAFSGNVGIAFENLSRTIQSFEVSGAIGDVTAGLELVAEQIELQRVDQPTKAEADQERASQEAWKTSQIGLLETIALSLTGGGGAGGDGGGEGGSGGGGMGKFGKGIASLGKGIGAFIKAIGKGAGLALKGLAIGFAALGKALIPLGKGIGLAISGILRGFASGVMAFANPLVIGGLAVFTVGMIGLGAALRIAAPAFEAIAPIMIKVADVIGNVLMTAIREVPEIFRSIGYVIESVGMTVTAIIDAIGGAIRKIGEGFQLVGDGIQRVLKGIEGVIRGIGDTISGVITSVAEGIATVVNSFKGPSLDEKTQAVQKLSNIDPTRMQLTAAGIEAIGEALDSIGGGVKIPFFSKESPVLGLLELAKNSGGILDASSAIDQFVKNASLFEKGVDIDDSVIEGIEKVVKSLGSGDPNGLNAFSNAINAINDLDMAKIGLLSKINIPQVMPPTAAEYERIFKALQTAEPSTIEKVQGFFSKVFGRSPREDRQARTPRGAGSAGAGPAYGDVGGAPALDENQMAAERERRSLRAAAKDVKGSRDERRIARLKAIIADPNTSAKKKIMAKRSLRRYEQLQAAGMSSENVIAAGGSMSAKVRQGQVISSSPPSAGEYGGGPSGGVNITTSAPTTNVNRYSSPVSPKPTSPSAETLRKIKDF